MQFTHNFKPKIVKQLSVILIAAVTALSFLSTTALAETPLPGHGLGDTQTTTAGSYIYGYDEVANLSWKIDLYIAASDNGKIDPTTDVIGSNKLPWVGAVMYDNYFDGSKVNPDQVWLSTDYTNESRNSFNAGKEAIIKNGYPTGEYKWTVPNATRVTKTQQVYTLTNGMVVGHYTDNPIGLPVEVEMIKEYNYKTLVQNKIEDVNNLKTILKNINTSLDPTRDVNDLTPLYGKIATLIGSGPLNKLQASKDATGNMDFDLLLPTNPNCIVEWVAVAVPVLGWRAGDAKTAYWETYVNGEFTLLGNGITRVTLGFDAYNTALYNETTKTMYKDSKMVEYAVSQGLNPNRKNGLALQIWNSIDCYYYVNGKLDAEAMYGICNVALAAYDTHPECSEYCGVPVAGEKRKSFATYQGMRDDPADYAKYGGITVYKSEIPEPGIPVYYYEYDSSDKPTGKVYTEDYKPNGKTTFTPSDKYGIPIADESNNATDKQYTNSMGIPYYADWWNTRDPITWDYDYRESSSTYGTIIDAQPKTGVASAANPVSIKNEELNIVSSNKKGNAKSIHVKVVEEPSTKVYYHTLTLTADLPDDKPAGTTAEQLFSSDPDLFEGSWTQTSRKISPSPKYTPVQNVNSLRAAQKPVDKSAQPWYNERKEVSLWDMFHR